jgi:hypothetical protein
MDVILRTAVDPFRGAARLICMRCDRRVADIRRELRERLMSQRADGVDAVLGRLWALAETQPELRREHARWAMRFELLALV